MTALPKKFQAMALGALVATAPVIGQAGGPTKYASLDSTTPTEHWRGKPVILRVGKGFSLSAAGGIADVLNQDGCPTTVTREGGDKWLPRLTVEVGDYSGKFKSTGSAGAMAQELCLGLDKT